MRKLLITLIISGIFVSCSDTSLGSGGKSKIENGVDSLSYCMGVDFGTNIKNQVENINKSLEIELDVDLIMAAFMDVLKENDTKIPADQVQQTFQTIGNRMYQKIIDKTKLEGIDFLEKNKTNDGIKITESGLQYEILREGTGPKPGKQDKVSVNYKGMLLDGTVFDETDEQPAPILLSQVIPGWVEALQLMKVGAKWKLYIPSELGYGERPPRGSQIPPSSVLIFEIELLEILEKDVANPRQQMQSPFVPSQQ